MHASRRGMEKVLLDRAGRHPKVVGQPVQPLCVGMCECGGGADDDLMICSDSSLALSLSVALLRLDLENWQNSTHASDSTVQLSSRYSYGTVLLSPHPSTRPIQSTNECIVSRTKKNSAPGGFFFFFFFLSLRFPSLHLQCPDQTENGRVGETQWGVGPMRSQRLPETSRNAAKRPYGWLHLDEELDRNVVVLNKQRDKLQECRLSFVM